MKSGCVAENETCTEWRLLKGGVARSFLYRMLVSRAATPGAVKPHSVGTPRPYEALQHRGSLHPSIRVGMKELSGTQGPPEGRGVPTASGPCVPDRG